MKLRFHPGETFVVNFVIPFEKYDVKAVLLSFRNQDRIVYEAMSTSIVPAKDSEGNVIPGKVRVGYLFSQAESLMFEENMDYTMQLNVYGFNSSRITSKEMYAQTLSQQIWDAGIGTQYAANGAINYGGWENPQYIDYDTLLNRPKINEITLTGNRELPENRITESQIDAITSNTNGGE